MNSFAGGVFPRFISNFWVAAPSVVQNRPTRESTLEPAQNGAIIETDIPFRLDALPFGRFHVLVIVALGITWILDGLEVTLAGALSGEVALLIDAAGTASAALATTIAVSSCTLCGATSIAARSIC